MATLIERLVYEMESDVDTDGGAIDVNFFQSALALWERGTIDAAYIKTQFAMTAAQATELDEILATRPVLPVAPLPADIIAQSQWRPFVIAHFYAGQYNANWPGFEHAPGIRTSLGLPNP